MTDYCNIPLVFKSNISLGRYQTFFYELYHIRHIPYSIVSQEFDTGVWVMVEYRWEDHDRMMEYIKSNKDVVEVDEDSLQDMEPFEADEE